jgi:hypothetical protein
MRALVLVLSLAACSGAPAPGAPVTPVSPAAPVRPAAAEPAPPPQPPPPRRGAFGPEGAPLAPFGPLTPRVIDPVGYALTGERQVYDKKSDYWSPCVRGFVQTQPEPTRIALGEALSTYGTGCRTQPRRRVEFRAPRLTRASATMQLVLVGAVEPTGCELTLRVAYRGEPARAERITLIADGERWTSPRLAFDSDSDGWEVAELPFTRELARQLRRALDARDTWLRFESAASYDDSAVGEDVKQDLRAMLDALEALSRP